MIAFQTLAIAPTLADRDGRHLVPILLFIFVFAAAGGVHLWERGQGAPRARVAERHTPA